MARRLAAFVHLHDENGVVCSYGPDDTVPAWAAEQITNPAAWSGEDDETSAEPNPAAPPEPASEPVPEAPTGEPADEQPQEATETAADAGTPADEPAGQVDDGPPPKGGPGSGRDAWAAYADRQGFEVEDGDGRDEIIAALEEADIPTERPEA